MNTQFRHILNGDYPVMHNKFLCILCLSKASAFLLLQLKKDLAEQGWITSGR
jgi:hypothetical protein